MLGAVLILSAVLAFDLAVVAGAAVLFLWGGSALGVPLPVLLALAPLAVWPAAWASVKVTRPALTWAAAEAPEVALRASSDEPEAPKPLVERPSRRLRPFGATAIARTGSLLECVALRRAPPGAAAPSSA